MGTGVRSNLLKLMVRSGLLPADTVLLYDHNAFEWHSGFGPYAQVMYSLVLSMRPECVVEIGAAYGKSTCFIAAALQRAGSGKLYSIDPHEVTHWNDGRPDDDTYQILLRRLHDLRLVQFVELLRTYSHIEARQWTKPIDILLLDGSHTYEDVKADWLGFAPHVKPGGLIVFHDTMWDFHKDSRFYRSDQGVPRLVQEIQDEGYPMVTLTAGWGLTILQNARGGYRLLSDNTSDAVVGLPAI